MGMYTEAVLRFYIKNDSPQELALRQRIDGEALPEVVLPYKKNKGDFRLNNLAMLFSDSWFFGGQTTCSITERSCFSTKAGENYFDYSKVTLAFNIKNYDKDIEALLEWLIPGLDPDQGFMGYIRYEEDDAPTLIYFKNSELSFVGNVNGALKND